MADIYETQLAKEIREAREAHDAIEARPLSLREVITNEIERRKRKVEHHKDKIWELQLRLVELGAPDAKD